MAHEYKSSEYRDPWSFVLVVRTALPIPPGLGEGLSKRYLIILMGIVYVYVKDNISKTYFLLIFRNLVSSFPHNLSIFTHRGITTWRSSVHTFANHETLYPAALWFCAHNDTLRDTNWVYVCMYVRTRRPSWRRINSLMWTNDWSVVKLMKSPRSYRNCSSF